MPPRSQSWRDWSHGSCSTSGTWHACWRSLKRGGSAGARDVQMGRRGELMGKELVEKDALAWRARMLVLIPLVVFFGLATLFMLRLGGGDPSRLSSPLIGPPAPPTDLPPLPGPARARTPVPGLCSAERPAQ